MFQLNPEVIDKAVEMTGSRSDDQLGQAFLDLTGTTIRNYRAGRSTPTIATLMRLKKITGIPLDRMVIETRGIEAA